MPEFRFSYTGKNARTRKGMLVPSKHGLTAKDIAEAFEKKDTFLTENGGRYIPGSMQKCGPITWHRVPEPARDKHSTARETAQSTNARLRSIIQI